jgi:hypothetical protein
VGNLLTFVTCLQAELRNTPTFIFTMFYSAFACVLLYGWNLNPLLITLYETAIGNFSLEACKAASFTQITTLEISNFLLVRVFSFLPFSNFSLVRFRFLYQWSGISVSGLKIGARFTSSRPGLMQASSC